MEEEEPFDARPMDEPRQTRTTTEASRSNPTPPPSTAFSDEPRQARTTSEMNSSRSNPMPPPSTAFSNLGSGGETASTSESPALASRFASERLRSSRDSASHEDDSFGLNGRWKQYESNPTYRAESERASARAVASAAERVANRQFLHESTPAEKVASQQETRARMPLQSNRTTETLTKPVAKQGDPNRFKYRSSTSDIAAKYSSTPGTTIPLQRSGSKDTASLIAKYANYAVPPPSSRSSRQHLTDGRSIRHEAMKMLDLVDHRLKTPLEVRRTESGGYRAEPALGGLDKPQSLRRTWSGVPDTSATSGPYAVRRTHSGNMSTGPDAEGIPAIPSTSSSATRTVPAALAGLDLTSRKSENQGRYMFRDTKFRDDDYLSEEEDQIIHAKASLDSMIMDVDNIDPLSPVSAEKATASWSDRYSSNRMPQEHVRILDLRESDRQRLSARNMFMTSVASQSAKIFGSGDNYRRHHVFGKQQERNENINLHGSWVDEPEETPTGTWKQVLWPKRKKRRRIVALSALLLLSLIIVISTTVRGGKKSGSKLNASVEEQTDNSGFTFYVSSDVPYELADEDKLSKDLENIPGDADFVVMLGNIQDSAVSLCPRTRYSDVASILKKSPAPMLVLPGADDWVKCPNPDLSFSMWMDAFVGFENNFDHDFELFRNSDRPENFAMLYNDVMIFGMNLVAGPIYDWNAWAELNNDMLAFYYGMLNLHKGEFDSVIILGNARPGPQQAEFFGGVVSSLEPIGKPVTYIHANSGYTQGNFTEYTPFEDYPEILGIEVQRGGEHPPLRITVGSGERPVTAGF